MKFTGDYKCRVTERKERGKKAKPHNLIILLSISSLSLLSISFVRSLVAVMWCVALSCTAIITVPGGGVNY